MDKEDVVHIYSGILLSLKKEKMPFAVIWMDLDIFILSEVSQKEKYHMISLICGIQNRTQMNLSMKRKWTHGHREQTGGCHGGGGWGER